MRGTPLRISRKMAIDAYNRRGEAVYHDGPEDDEAHNGPHVLDGLVVGAVAGRVRLRRRRARLEPGARLHGQEHGAHAHGTKVACEDGLAPGPDLGHEALERDHEGQAAEQQDQDGDGQKTPGAQLAKADVLVPGDDGAKVYKHGRVEQQVNDAGQLHLVRLFMEPAVPAECGACSKGDEKVV